MQHTRHEAASRAEQGEAMMAQVIQETFHRGGLKHEATWDLAQTPSVGFFGDMLYFDGRVAICI